MRKFLQRFLLFCFLITFVVFSANFLSNYILNFKFNFNLNANKNILILGDSQTQCAINDTIIDNAINLSESADTYFYSYLKLKKLIPKNSQIDTLFLAYAPHNVSKTQDSWLVDESINDFKLPLHFFLFENEDVLNFAKIAPFQLLKKYPKVLVKNASHLFRVYKNEPINRYGIGGYKAIFHKISESYNQKPPLIVQKKQNNYAKVDLVYLKKIYKYCSDKNIKIILIATPITPDVLTNELRFYKKYKEFAKNNLAKATIFNFSKYPMEKKYFADEVHLNYDGANLFSLMLKNKIKVKI